MGPAAIVTYMGYSGLGIVRSLGRRGIPVITLDPDVSEIGMSSRFCTSRQCPAIEKSTERNLDFLVGLARSLPAKPVLFPTSDNAVHAYAAREDVLRPYVCLTTPSSDIIAKTAAKDALFRTAREKGIPVPETYVPKSLDDVKAFASSIPYPCLIKPVRSNSWHQQSVQKTLKGISGGSEKSILAKTPEALIEAYTRISELDADVIVSEAIPGDDRDLVYFAFYRARRWQSLACLGQEGAGDANSLWQRQLRCFDRDPMLERISLDFLEKLNYQGLGGIEFKRDSRDGKLKLIELNTRYGLWDALGQLCGVDTAYVAYSMRSARSSPASSGAFRREMDFDIS